MATHLTILSDLKVTDVAVDHLDENPTGDSYDVPLLLNRATDDREKAYFTEGWYAPHQAKVSRPRATLEGGLIVLEKTTIEDVIAYHADQVKVIVDRVNHRTRQLRQQEAVEAEQQRIDALPHRERVAELARRINWD